MMGNREDVFNQVMTIFLICLIYPITPFEVFQAERIYRRIFQHVNRIILDLALRHNYDDPTHLPSREPSRAKSCHR